jgi:two-component system response regulator YesN
MENQKLCSAFRTGTARDFFRLCRIYVCAEDISLSDMTKRSAVSRAQFCKLFKDASGLGFNDYLNRKRIQRALALIKSGEKIADVAYASGYSEISTFYHSFRKFTQASPSGYKEASKVNK